MVWDRGTWIPDDPDVDAALRGGLKFTLQGETLKGSWVLVRARSGYPTSSGRPAWLLIKHRDAYATNREVTTALPASVLSHRTLAEIAQAEGGSVQKTAGADLSGGGRRSPEGASAAHPRARPRRPAPARERSR